MLLQYRPCPHQHGFPASEFLFRKSLCMAQEKSRISFKKPTLFRDFSVLDLMKILPPFLRDFVDEHGYT